MSVPRPPLTGMPLGTPPAPALGPVAAKQEPPKETATMVANQILKALASRTGWTPSGVLREAINPRRPENWKEAIRQLRDTGMIEAMGHTRWVRYRLGAKAKTQEPKAPIAKVSMCSTVSASPPHASPVEPADVKEPGQQQDGPQAAAPPPNDSSRATQSADTDDLIPEIRLMAELDQVVNHWKLRACIDDDAIARATAWLRNKFRKAA